MMNKIILPGSYHFDAPVTRQIKLSSHGLLGDDLGTFIKRAGYKMADEVRRIKFASGEVPVHLIAIGATEFFGCFTAGTPIAMADGRYQSIETLQVGDEVLSADGHVCPISNLFRRQAERTIQLDVSGLADELVCSDEHPFRVARREQFICNHDRHKRCFPITQGKQNICNRAVTPWPCVTNDYRAIVWEWATAATIREGDFLVWTAPDLPVALSVSENEGYLLGAWLAEGSFQRNPSNHAVSSIALDIHSGEIEFLSRLEMCAAAMSLTCRSYVYESEPNSRRVTVTGNPDRFRIWHTLFNEHAKTKRLPPWVCCLPRPVRLAILAGYLDGDGSCVIADKENRTTARSHGRDLSMGMQRLFWSLGIPAVRCRAKEGWNVSAANSALTELIPWSWKVKSRTLLQTTKVHGFCHENRTYLPVRSILVGGPAEVFNFEVEGDHTYSGPNVDSHNCNRNGDAFDEDVCRKFHPTFVKHARWFRNHANRDPSKSYGRIVHSAYNEPMHRIELIAALNGTKEAANRNGGLVADEELNMLHSGSDIPVSMACSVPFDICSGCGNKARTRAEYCKGEDQGGHCKEGGCATRLGQVNENGHHLHVKNTVPKFFDLSKVWRGADHTAYTLGIIEKAAAAGGVVLGGAEIAERIGLTSPFELFVETVSEQKVASQLRLARQLSMLETKAQKDNSFHKHAGAFIPAVQNPLPLGLLNSPETRAQGLKALALEKIALPLRDFLHMYLEGNAVKAAEMTPLVAPYLRDIYGQLTDHPEELAAGIRAGKYLHDPRRPTKEASAWARELTADYSLDPRLVERRAWRAALREIEPRNSYNSPLDKTASNSGELQTIAKEYALYKLAMLNEIREYDPNFVLTCDLAIRQNHIS